MRHLLYALAFLLPASLAAQDSLCVQRTQGNKGRVCVAIPVDTVVRVDTVIQRDTVIRTDTLIKTDTLTRVDTLVRVDTTVRVDTLVRVRVDTLVRTDTLWLPKPPVDSTPPPVDTLPPPPVDTLPPPPVDTTPPPPPKPAGLAELPRSLPVVPVGLDTLPCNAKANLGLQVALNNLRGGDVLCLTGAYRANFTVPARSDTGWAVIRSAQPCPAGRIQPTLYAGARIQSPNNFAALQFKARAHHTLLLCMEVTSDSTLPNGPNPIIAIGASTETLVADLPSDIALDRVWVHGWAHQATRRGVIGNGRSMTMVRSWCEEIHDGNDSQCWISWNGAGPLLLEDNYLEAASENIMFGGGDPRVPGLVMSDVTIRRNHITKPLSWLGKPWNVKNLIETKSSTRVLVEENVIARVWAQGQVGYAFVIKSTAQNSNCLPCGTSDWTIRRNLIDSVGAGFSIAGRADQRLAYTDTAGVLRAATGTTDSTNRRIVIQENWIGPLVKLGTIAVDARPVLFTSQNHDVALLGNTFEPSAIVKEAILFNTTSTWPNPVWNLTVSDNVLPRGQYGMGLSAIGEGLRAWTGGASGTSTWTNNSLIGRTSVTYPLGTTWHIDLTSALGVAGVQKSVIDAAVRGVVVPR